MSKSALAKRLLAIAHVLLKEERVATINDDQTLEGLVSMQLEGELQSIEEEDPDTFTYEDGSKNLREMEGMIETSNVEAEAEAFDSAVTKALLEWVPKHMAEYNTKSGPLEGMADDPDAIVDVMSELRGGAGYLYYMEHEGHGVGTWDGEWNPMFLEPKPALKEQSKFVLSKTKNEYNKLQDAIMNESFRIVEEFKNSKRNSKMN